MQTLLLFSFYALLGSTAFARFGRDFSRETTYRPSFYIQVVAPNEASRFLFYQDGDRHVLLKTRLESLGFEKDSKALEDTLANVVAATKSVRIKADYFLSRSVLTSEREAVARINFQPSSIHLFLDACAFVSTTEASLPEQLAPALSDAIAILPRLVEVHLYVMLPQEYQQPLSHIPGLPVSSISVLPCICSTTTAELIQALTQSSAWQHRKGEAYYLFMNLGWSLHPLALASALHMDSLHPHRISHVMAFTQATQPNATTLQRINVATMLVDRNSLHYWTLQNKAQAAAAVQRWKAFPEPIFLRKTTLRRMMEDGLLVPKGSCDVSVAPIAHVLHTSGVLPGHALCSCNEADPPFMDLLLVAMMDKGLHIARPLTDLADLRVLEAAVEAA